MPYGSGSPASKAAYVYTSGTGLTSTSEFKGNYEEGKAWSRTGTNYNSSAIRNAPRVPDEYAWETRAVKVYSGPRLPYRVWNKKLGKYIWAREPITVYKTKKVLKKAGSRRAKGLDLQPNALSYSETKVEYSGDSSVSATSSLYNKTQTYTGALFTDFRLAFGPSSYVTQSAFNYVGPGFSSRYASAIAKADDRARSRFHEKVKNQSVNIGQMIAERGQTATMFADLLTRLATAVAAVRKGNLAGAANKLFPGDSKELANDWLMLQYGIKPLLSDLEGVASSIQKPEPLVFDIIVKEKEELQRMDLLDVTDSSYVKCRTYVTTEGYVEVTYKARFEVDFPVMRQASKLGLSNLLSLGWELIPWSFVVDWAIPIGQYLNNLDSTSGLRLKSQTRTIYQKEKVSFVRQFGGADTNTFIWDNAVVTAKAEKTKVDRTILTTVPSLDFPSFKDPLSLGHMANALALLRQIL